MTYRTADSGRGAHGWRGSRLGRVYRHRTTRSDRGAALIEAAIILPVLMVFLLGIIEFGLVYATGATATGASRTGARLAVATFGPNKAAVTGSVQGPADLVADQVSGDLTALTSAVPIGMVIYKANSSGAPTGGYPSSTASMSGGCTADCMRYTWNTSTKKFTPSGGPGWNLSTNDVCLPASTASVGVWVLIRHSYLTKLIGQYNFVEGRTVMRLEPLPGDQC